MSIIYDALKKLEKKSDNSFSKESYDFGKKNFRFKKTPFLVILMGVFFGAAFYLSYNFFGFWTKESKDVDVAREQEEASLEQVAAFQEQEKKEPTSKESRRYRLEGIILGGRSSAIVNGKMVYEQDEIDGFVVARISKDSVVLIDSVSYEEKILSLDF